MTFLGGSLSKKSCQLFSRHPCYLLHLLIIVICSDCLNFFRTIFWHIPLPLYSDWKQRKLNKAFHLERSKDKCFPINCAKNPLGFWLISAGSSPFQMSLVEWISPPLTPRPHSFLYLFALSTHKVLNLYTMSSPPNHQLPESRVHILLVVVPSTDAQ